LTVVTEVNPAARPAETQEGGRASTIEGPEFGNLLALLLALLAVPAQAEAPSSVPLAAGTAVEGGAQGSQQAPVGSGAAWSAGGAEPGVPVDGPQGGLADAAARAAPAPVEGAAQNAPASAPPVLASEAEAAGVELTVPAGVGARVAESGNRPACPDAPGRSEAKSAGAEPSEPRAAPAPVNPDGEARADFLPAVSRADGPEKAVQALRFTAGTGGESSGLQGPGAGVSETAGGRVAGEEAFGPVGRARAEGAEVTVARELVQQGLAVWQHGYGYVRLKLKPDFLGRVEVQVSSHLGRLSAQVVVENEAARQLLQGSFSHLRDNLAQYGLNLERLSVEVGGYGSGAAQSEGRDSGYYHYYPSVPEFGPAAEPGTPESFRSLVNCLA
jgi:hypothetical protein